MQDAQTRRAFGVRMNRCAYAEAERRYENEDCDDPLFEAPQDNDDELEHDLWRELEEQR